MITIEEFMTAEPRTLKSTDTITDAWRIMTEQHIRHIPITDADEHLVGLVTQRDVLAATDPCEIADGGSDTALADIMIRDVSVIEKEDSLRKAAMFIREHKYGCMPVVSDDKLVGIITDSDFVAIAINLIEQAELYEQEMDVDLDNEF